MNRKDESFQDEMVLVNYENFCLQTMLSKRCINLIVRELIFPENMAFDN